MGMHFCHQWKVHLVQVGIDMCNIHYDPYGCLVYESNTGFQRQCHLNVDSSKKRLSEMVKADPKRLGLPSSSVKAGPPEIAACFKD
jgi:hypothetical protein